MLRDENGAETRLFPAARIREEFTTPCRLERPVYQLPDVFANQDCEILDRFHRKANATKERQKERIAAAAEANFEIVVVDGAVLLSVVIWLID